MSIQHLILIRCDHCGGEIRGFDPDIPGRLDLIDEVYAFDAYRDGNVGEPSYGECYAVEVACNACAQKFEGSHGDNFATAHAAKLEAWANQRERRAAVATSEGDEKAGENAWAMLEHLFDQVLVFDWASE